MDTIANAVTQLGVPALVYFYLKILPQIKDSIQSFLTQHLEWPLSVHMQKKCGEFEQKWPS